jgi:hypothetical protein
MIINGLTVLIVIEHSLHTMVYCSLHMLLVVVISPNLGDLAAHYHQNCVLLEAMHSSWSKPSSTSIPYYWWFGFHLFHHANGNGNPGSLWFIGGYKLYYLTLLSIEISKMLHRIAIHWILSGGLWLTGSFFFWMLAVGAFPSGIIDMSLHIFKIFEIELY